MTQADTIAEVNLPATLDADAASALVAELKELSRSREIHLDASAVAAISPGYLQILISAFKTFPRLSVAHASTDFVDAFAAYGLEYPVAEVSTSQPAQVSAPDPSPASVAAPPAEDVSEAAPAEDVSAVPVTEAATPPAAEPGESSPPATEASQRSPAGPADEGQAEGEAVAAKTILTIDDSRTMRDMLKMALGGAGFTVIQAVDGQDGLNALAQQPVDLIITDINMPKLDGFGVIRAVRNDPTYNQTPILVLSTEGEQESKDIAKDAGATGWIVKPFDPAGLVKIINTECGQR